MLTRSKTKRQREASEPVLDEPVPDEPVHLDSKDVGHGISWLKIRTPNGKKRKSHFRCQKYERQGQQLLPGISNEITLILITPKLPWITFHTLLSVSSSWRQAIQSRQVYNARCRAHATEALITISPLCNPSVKDGEDEDQWIGLYSMREEKIYRLPGISPSTGIPRACQCISLDGKVYLIGGLSSSGTARRSMYALDLVASKGWKRCASMKIGRSGFGCCIVDGKIFVCGGRAGRRSRENTNRSTILLHPEVYDPELDLWSSLKSMTSLRVGNQVAVLGDEILVHSGYVYHRHQRGVASPNFPEIYNPTLDEWRTVEDPMLSSDELNKGKCLFITQGKIHSLDYTWPTEGKWRVQVYNLDSKSWSKARKSLLFDVSGKFVIELATPLVVDNEIVRLIGAGLICANPTLMHSAGFSVQRKIRAWQTAKTPFRIAYEPFLRPRMSIIRL